MRQDYNLTLFKIIKTLRGILVATLFVSVGLLSTAHSQALSGSLSSDAVRSSEFLDDLLAKERYLDYLSTNLSVMSSGIGEEEFSEIYRQYVSQQGSPKKISINDFGYVGGPEGRIYSFPSQVDYERFVQYLHYFNTHQRLTAYKKAIIKNAAPSVSNRLFEQELVSAVRSFNIGDYQTARLQFRDIHDTYSELRKGNLDEVLYYHAESSFGMRFYSEALEVYNQLIKTYPQSSKSPAAAHKIIFIHYVNSDFNKVVSAYNRFQSTLSMDSQALDKTLTVLATIEYENKNYKKAIQYLDGLSKRGREDQMTQFLLGTIYLNLNDNANAETQFKKVVDQTVWPWTEKIYTYLKNSAYLQLGYLNYRNGKAKMKEARDLYEQGFEKKSTFERRFALNYYIQAENYFRKISKGYPEFEVAQLAKIWAEFKKSNFDDSKDEIDDFVKRFKSSDIIYQGLYLSGHISQVEDPTDPKVSLKDFYYVFNGMATNEYVKKFYVQKRTLDQQRRNVLNVINSTSSPIEKSAAQELIVTLNKALELVNIDRNSFVASDTSLFTAQQYNELSAFMPVMQEAKSKMAKSGYLNLASFAQRGYSAYKKLVELSLQPITDEIRLFVEHSSIFYSNEVQDFNDYINHYLVSLTNNENQSLSQIQKLGSFKSNSLHQKALVGYLKNNAEIIRNRSSLIKTLLAESQFYASNNIDFAGETAQYAFSGLLYDQIKDKRKLIDHYRKTVNIFKNAARNKVEQMEFYLRELDREDVEEVKIENVDAMQQQFESIIGDFRKAFFEGTDHLLIKKQ